MDVNSKLMLKAKRKSSIGDDKPKKKSREYSDTYLDFGFTFILQNGKEKPQCVICNKILASESMLLSQTLFGNPKGPVELGNPNTCAETKLCLNFILFRLKK